MPKPKRSKRQEKSSGTSAKVDRFSKLKVEAEIRKRATSPAKLRDWLDRWFPFIIGPRITYFEPTAGPPGTLVTIHGEQFSAVRDENLVTVANQSAMVVSATATELKVITASNIADGPVKVTVGSHTASGPQDFLVLGYPSAGGGEDGPPIAFAGAGQGSQGDVNPIGTIRILVALCTPNDLTPTAAARNTVVDTWNRVVTFYNQASYGKTVVQVDITTNWKRIDSAQAPLLKDNNIDGAQLPRVMAFSAQGAVDEGFNLDNYAMMASVMFLNGGFIRAWGNFSQQNFTYNNGLPQGDPNRININLTANHQISLIAIQETANWGRCAHEFGHNIVSAPNFAGDGSATLGEDVYDSDLVDGAAATAQSFELMGDHDTHPLFSGFHLDKLGYYTAANVKQLTWDRNPFKEEFDVVAHGLAEDNSAGRFHLIKIKIADGLHYYVQVRQRPGATAQVFDDNIPLAGAPNMGGVIVTSAIADLLHTNQQTRFITLLHPNNVLKQNDSVEDPARTIRITVVNDNVQARPQVCKVRVEWAQTVADDPSGSFDLKVDPWDSNWQTPDIWIDRAPFGTFDNPNDAEGRPTGSGDKPRPMEINHFHTRIHVSGAMGASNVKVTFYAVFPPGIGDNGNWSPLASQTINNIGQNSFSDVFSNWTPVVGQHTCLKVYASQQLGEISGGNNSAQENVFNFEAPASSPPAPVLIRTAIRNPLDERKMVSLALSGVPLGYFVHFPHQWVWLDPKSERHFDLVVVPTLDYAVYKERKIPMVANIRATGWLPRQYDELVPPFHQQPGSRYYPIGGTLNRVRVVKKVDIDLNEDREKGQGSKIALRGGLTPAFAKQRVRVDLYDPLGALRVVETVTDSAGVFQAVFDLKYEASLESDRKTWKKARAILKGTYRAQAHIVVADEVASASSGFVFVQK
ncbi:MAG: IPT/TIG domain-containing protein [Planctomycetota bacterium]|nr:IPT/TIG domain-containing protein [Planctomycetota bacterium]